MKKIIVTGFVCAIVLFDNAKAQSVSATKPENMKILVHITQGPENPTRAALGFLVARTCVEKGYKVNVFLAGDAVHLMKDGMLNSISGLGTGKLKEHYDVIVKNGTRFYLSGNSSKERNVTEADINGKPAQFAMPDVLVQLAVDSDRLFTY